LKITKISNKKSHPLGDGIKDYVNTYIKNNDSLVESLKRKENNVWQVSHPKDPGKPSSIGNLTYASIY